MKSKNIEVEARSFIDDRQYSEILSKLRKGARFIKEIDEETVYFSGKKDLRLRRNKKEAFLILKEGKIHDDHRKEFEVKMNISDFENMENLLKSLGYEIEIKWFRKRLEFQQGDIKILLDDTKGYGKIIELERIVLAGEEKEIHKELKDKLKCFNIKITSKEGFNKAFENYKKNWKNLTVLGVQVSTCKDVLKT